MMLRWPVDVNPVAFVLGHAAVSGECVRRFVFRFEAVKRQRDAMLDVAKGELAEVVQRHTLATELLAEKRAALAASTAGRASGALDPRRERIRQLHLHALRDEIGRRERQLAELEEALAEVRGKVAEAHRRLRAIEVLEERDREAWKLETAREEQQEADERSAQRFGRD